MMELRVLRTGSGGNCYLLEYRGETLILDAGIRVQNIMLAIDNPAQIAGCLITHEHGDHALSAVKLARRGVSVVASQGTVNAIKAESEGFIIAKPLEVLHVGGFKVMPFKAEHDAAEPMGFLISAGKERLVYLTDSFYCKYQFPGVHYWVVECNYIDELTADTDETLRRRLIQSHMSLRRLIDMLNANDLSESRQIVLVHLSDGRSDEQRMVREISEITDAEVIAAREGLSIRLSAEPF